MSRGVFVNQMSLKWMQMVIYPGLIVIKEIQIEGVIFTVIKS